LWDALGITIEPSSRKAAEFRTATELRRRFSELTRSPKQWQQRVWTPSEFNEIIRIVEVSSSIPSEESEAQLLLEELGPSNSYTPRSGESQDGFVAWRLFRDRHPVPRSPGVYVFAILDSPPTSLPDPLDPRVIYIGTTDNQVLLVRLQQFEDTALGGIGHSGGWSYRIEVYSHSPTRLARFHRTYVSWKSIASDGGISPSGYESMLLANYASAHGHLPRLNRKG
jgi:hypothetical protein